MVPGVPAVGTRQDQRIRKGLKNVLNRRRAGARQGQAGGIPLRNTHLYVLTCGPTGATISCCPGRPTEARQRRAHAERVQADPMATIRTFRCLKPDGRNVCGERRSKPEQANYPYDATPLASTSTQRRHTMARIQTNRNVLATAALLMMLWASSIHGQPMTFDVTWICGSGDYCADLQCWDPDFGVPPCNIGDTALFNVTIPSGNGTVTVDCNCEVNGLHSRGMQGIQGDRGWHLLRCGPSHHRFCSVACRGWGNIQC